MGNAAGDDGVVVRASAEAEMAAYDALPRELREALADAALGWSAVDVLARWRRAAARYGEARATRAGVKAVRAAVAG